MELNHLKLNTPNFPNIKTANFQTIEDKIILTYEKLKYLLDFFIFLLQTYFLFLCIQNT